MKTYKLAIIGIDHIHTYQLFYSINNYLGDRAEWIGYADTTNCDETVLALKRKMNFNDADMQKMPYFEDYRELLDQKPDIAVVCSDVASHGALCEETLSRNIHTIIEKPMSTTLEDGVRMYRASKKSEATLVINWPVAWFPSFHLAKKLADSGVVGDVLRFQYRSPATLGPYKIGAYTEEELQSIWWYQKNRGGGSIMDYAGYGCTLSTWFMGNKLPKRVSGVSKNFFLPFSDVPDYSTFTMEYENAVSIIEGSWSTLNNGQVPTGPVIYGTEGTIVADRINPEVRIYKGLSKVNDPQDATEVLLPEEKPSNVVKNLLDHLEKGTPLHELITVDFNIRALAVLDAGNRSCDSGKFETVEKIW